MNNIETGQHPTLHAFPTRRSSDLGAAAGEYAASAAGEYGRRSGVRAPVRAAAENSVCFGTGGAAGSARPDRRLRADGEPAPGPGSPAGGRLLSGPSGADREAAREEIHG